MDLPTYTSIWRIEKRLYKLYDFRLPMPVPVGQIAVFAAITVPYVIILTVLGLPFSHTLFWLYVLPPGVLTWLATRPVLESKRLPELIISQVRYLGEPATWCRMSPLAEKDEIVVVGRVWRRAAEPVQAPAPPRPRPGGLYRPAPGPRLPRSRPVPPPRRPPPGLPLRRRPSGPAWPGRAAGVSPARRPGPARCPGRGYRFPVSRYLCAPPAGLSRPVAFGQPATAAPAAAAPPDQGAGIPAVPPAPAARPVSLAPPVPVAEPAPPAQPRPDGQASPAGHAAPARRPRWPGTADRPGLPPVVPAARPAPSEPTALPGTAARPDTARPEAALPLTGMPEIAHDDRQGPPRPAGPPGRPDPAPSQHPAALAPGETARPGWPGSPAGPRLSRPRLSPGRTESRERHHRPRPPPRPASAARAERGVRPPARTSRPGRARRHRPPPSRRFVLRRAAGSRVGPAATSRGGSAATSRSSRAGRGVQHAGGVRGGSGGASC